MSERNARLLRRVAKLVAEAEQSKQPSAFTPTRRDFYRRFRLEFRRISQKRRAQIRKRDAREMTRIAAARAGTP